MADFRAPARASRLGHLDMALLSYIDTPSPIHRIDPRARIIVCAALLLALAAVSRTAILAASWACALAAILFCRLPAPRLLPRVAALNALLLLWWLTAPLIDPERGARLALTATCKANAMLLILTLLVSTIEASALGHALAHLRVPRKLAHLLLFTVRYAEVLWSEHQRMWRAMRARAFRPRMNRHTYRAVSRMLGMLLVRSVDRADRILAAMRCRGYRGEFYLLHHFQFRSADAVFALTGLALAAGLAAWGAA